MTRVAFSLLVGAAAAAGLAAQEARDLRTTVAGWVQKNQPAIVGELLDLLSIPNVAADRSNIRRNAEHLRGLLAKRGFRAELLETEGNPLVYGELVVPGAARTLLLYSHYDGQPVDPRAWHQADPFSPVVRTARVDRGGELVSGVASVTRFEDDWRVYARSASDDKSPIVALCAALDALKAASLSPTANVRVILDGEEEAGSPSLVPAIGRYRPRLEADLMVILDGPIHSSGRPTIAYGARGIVTLDLTVFGPRSGVHSGNYGNWVPNPAQRLAALLASMKGDDGRVLVKGFYDRVVPLTAEEQALLDAVPDDTEQMLKTFGVARPETAFPKLQAALQVPTLNVRGMTSAHVGAGARTIVPDRAIAAIDIRLVKETGAADLVEKVREHIRAQGYHLVTGEPDEAARSRYSKLASVDVRGTATNAFRTPPADPQARRIADALTRTFGGAPVQLRTLGGTVPIAPFVERLGFPAILVPLVNFDNNQHEENENLRLGHFFQGIEIVAAILTS
ncbi:MAG TPA: M20/M25/M40 family metallo-hydrolase [Vicinamibacterales bacterium]|nr:M20/M25/M40 family metallo-hydrolase [Vicinamibacterales bacterium]